MRCNLLLVKPGRPEHILPRMLDAVFVTEAEFKGEDRPVVLVLCVGDGPVPRLTLLQEKVSC